MNRLAIFDCDGTLVDSQHNICLAMEACFAAAGLAAPPPRADARAWSASAWSRRCGRCFPTPSRTATPRSPRATSAPSRRCAARGLVDEPLYEGIAELIDALDADGWLLGVATGKSDRGLALCLEHHGLAGRFVTLQTADRHPSKPHPVDDRAGAWPRPARRPRRA